MACVAPRPALRAKDGWDGRRRSRLYGRFVLYAFVGIQMGGLRPPIGAPNGPVRFFRADPSGNAWQVVDRLIAHAAVSLFQSLAVVRAIAATAVSTLAVAGQRGHAEAGLLDDGEVARPIVAALQHRNHSANHECWRYRMEPEQHDTRLGWQAGAVSQLTKVFVECHEHTLFGHGAGEYIGVTAAR